MGCLHADQRNRDSLALDAMEPVRADVDAFLLDP
jgi:CRISPR/Cas system-associated endonuclease Cas1